MLELDGMLGLVLIGVWVFCIFDVIVSDPGRVRYLPKVVWLLCVLLVPEVGALAWLVLGRPTKTGTGQRGSRRGVTPARRAPSARARGQEEAEIMARIQERDRQLARWAEEDQRKAQGGGPSPQ